MLRYFKVTGSAVENVGLSCKRCVTWDMWCDLVIFCGLFRLSTTKKAISNHLTFFLSTEKGPGIRLDAYEYILVNTDGDSNSLDNSSDLHTTL